ncbi:hypothetical protein FDUTEX481_03321 [Tolypothrix sp. PCC 7601]|nr:hypothetical protein FDUTEX481_03321 [Tolypothrix sp. PCC 7601]
MQKCKGKRGKKKPLTLTLSPAETLRVACFPVGVHLFPKPNSELKILNRAVLELHSCLSSSTQDIPQGFMMNKTSAIAHDEYFDVG